MTDPVTREIKIGMIDSSHPKIQEIEDVIHEDDPNDPEDIHGQQVGSVLVKSVKAHGQFTNPEHVKIQSTIHRSRNADLAAIKDAIDCGNHIITLSVAPHPSYYLTENGWLYYDRIDYIQSIAKGNLIFAACHNDVKKDSEKTANYEYYYTNHHYTIPVGALYYKNDFKHIFPNYWTKQYDALTRWCVSFIIDAEEELRSTVEKQTHNSPGPSVWISDRSFNEELKIGTSLATPRMAGSAGVIAWRNLKPRTRGDFPTLAKQYLGASAQHINSATLFQGWETLEQSKKARKVSYNDAKNYNFGGLGFSDEHGTGQYDAQAFYNLCLSHSPEFDIKLPKKKVFFRSVSPINKAKVITVDFDCYNYGTKNEFINGVYFAFENLKRMDIKTITIESPSGSKSVFFDDYTSYRTLKSDAVDKAQHEDLISFSHESNRHFGEPMIDGTWKAVLEFYEEISTKEKVIFSLEFKAFEQKPGLMLISNKIFHLKNNIDGFDRAFNNNENSYLPSDVFANVFDFPKRNFTYKSDPNQLDYLNLAATSSTNIVDLTKGQAILTYQYDHANIRTAYDLYEVEENIKNGESNLKVVEITIDPNTIVEYVADGSGDGQITGNKANNKLLGLDGDDVLRGEAGDDRLYPGRAHKLDQTFGGPGNDIHYLWSYEPGTCSVNDDTKGRNTIVFYISYEETISRSIDSMTKEISNKVDHKPLTLDDVKFSKTTEKEPLYWIQAGNKKIRFNPNEIQSVVLKHGLTGETRTYDKKALGALFSK